MPQEFSATEERFFEETSSVYQLATSLLEKADIHINGSRPWDMQLLAPGVIERALAQGNLGLGEAFMDGDWDAEKLDEFFFHLIRADIAQHIKPLRLIFHTFRSRVLNRQNRKRAWQVGETHYDLGNDFYSSMLDPRMTYTCGYWKNAKNLTEAQDAKLELICQKLQLKPGMRVLDIGCGWGSFMGYAAEHYGVTCVGLTISREQVDFGYTRYNGMPIEFRLQDYRDVNEAFDRIVSVGMFEHVGHKNYQVFMEVANRCLKDDGLFLLHTIGKNANHSVSDPWLDKYIFPNGELPTFNQLGEAFEHHFIVEDFHNFGSDYDKTLLAWYDNFIKAWPQFSDRLDIRFYRMWRYYLLSCAGAFRARQTHLWQWVLSKNGTLGGYRRPDF